MQALLLSEYGKLAVTDLPEPQLGPGEVLLRIKACGICGSDVHGYDGASGRRIPPVVMGHEAAGVIAAVGPNVTRWKPGDRVTFDSTLYCGHCAPCLRGEVNLCDNRQVFGVSCGDYRRNGAFAEYLAVPEHILYRLPDTMNFSDAALIEATAVALHAVSLGEVLRGMSALVLGAGMIGALVIQGLRHAGCRVVYAADPDSSRLRLARQFGAETIESSNSDPAAVVLDATRNEGVDRVFEAVGIADTIQTAVRAVRKGGIVTLVGNIAPTVPLALQAVVTRQIRLQGSCSSAGEYGRAIELMSSGHIQVKPFITATAPLAQGADWFRRLHGREPNLMKVVLEP